VYAGHAALAMLAKGVRPRVSLAVLVPVAFGPDWVEWILDAFGRQSRVLSHSLISMAIGATLVAVIYWAVTKAPAAAAVVWLTYVSHWPADFITGIKPTWPGGPDVGLLMYGDPVADIAVEWSLIMICWLAYRRSLPPRGHASKAGWLMPLTLMASQIAFHAIQTPEVKEQVREVITFVAPARGHSLRPG
jgi:membrane-bound metal-dependent hydrolase YbcI (DUF457 family)